MEHIHPIVDDDPHFSINTETREITYTSEEKLVLIQGDHNSERFTFELPRTIDNHDMSDCNFVQVHFINIDGQNPETLSSDVYEVDDLKVKEDDEDIVVCSWLVSQSATKYSGTLNFALSFKCRDDNNKVTYVWNTAPYGGVLISNGINSADAIVIEYGDVLDKWYAEFITASDSALASIDIAKRSAEDEIDAFAKRAAESYSAEYAEKLKSTLTVDVLGVENVLVQEKGNNPDKIMSQKSVTTELNKIESDYKNEMVETVNEVREIAANITKNSLVPIIIKGAGTEENPYYFEVEIGQKYRIYRTKTNNEWDVMFTIITGSTQQQASIPANPYRDFSTIIVKSVEYVNAGGGLISDLRIRYELDGSNCVRNFDLENPVEMWNRVYIDNVDKAYLVDEDAEYITDANGIADITKTASGLHGVDVYYANDEVKNWTEEGSGCTACIVTDLPASMRVSSNGIYHFYVIESSGEIYISLDGTTGQRFIDHYEGTAGWSEGWLDDVPDTSTQMGYYAVRTFKPLTDTYTISFDNGETRTFTVENGNGISSVERTDRGDYEYTYTMHLTDGTSTTFKVPNGGSVGIKKTVTGEIVSIDDISPIEHGVKVNVKSKNLIGYFLSDKEVVRDGVTFIVSAYDDTITLNGTCGTEAGGRNSFNDVAMPFTLERGKTYTLSQELVSGTVTGGTYGVYVSTLDGYDVVANISSAGADLVKTFIPEETVECFIGVNIVANTTYEDAVIRFQLEEGSTATEYTPYVDISTLKLRTCGKNLIPFPYPLLSGTTEKKGVTITVRDDGGILLNGTATGSIFINLANVVMGSETIFFYSTHGFRANRHESGIECAYDSTNGLTYIHVPSGTVFDNVVFYPQIEAGTVSTAYEKGIPAVVYTPNLDGTVSGVNSIAPVMNIFADKPGVIIEAKYNKDIQAMLERTHSIETRVNDMETRVDNAESRLETVYRNYEKCVDVTYQFSAEDDTAVHEQVIAENIEIDPFHHYVIRVHPPIDLTVTNGSFVEIYLWHEADDISIGWSRFDESFPYRGGTIDLHEYRNPYSCTAMYCDDEDHYEGWKLVITHKGQSSDRKLRITVEKAIDNGLTLYNHYINITSSHIGGRINYICHDQSPIFGHYGIGAIYRQIERNNFSEAFLNSVRCIPAPPYLFTNALVIEEFYMPHAVFLYKDRLEVNYVDGDGKIQSVDILYEDIDIDDYTITQLPTPGLL